MSMEKSRTSNEICFSLQGRDYTIDELECTTILKVPLVFLILQRKSKLVSA
jgi:hypothetical protein